MRRWLLPLALAVAAAAAVAAACHGSPSEPPLDRHLVEVIHADGRFVAVGGMYDLDNSDAGGAAIATSVDGDTWQSRTLPGYQLMRTVTHGNGRWLVAGTTLDARPAMLVSTDLTTWRPSTAPPAARVSGLAFGNGVFVAVSDAGFHVSSDGDAWTAIDVGPDWLNPEVAFLGDRFVAFGQNPMIAESIDGRTWTIEEVRVTHVPSMVSHGGRVIGIGYHDCCRGEDPDGIDGFVLQGPGGWQTRAHEGEPIGDLAIADGALIAVSDSGVRRADDPVGTWVLQPVAPGVGASAVAANGRTVVAVGRGIDASHDGGRTWTRIAP